MQGLPPHETFPGGICKDGYATYPNKCKAECLPGFAGMQGASGETTACGTAGNAVRREGTGLSASDRFQTGFRPVSDRCQTSVKYRICTVHVIVPLLPHAQSTPPVRSAESCRMHRSVMSDAQCPFGCTVLTEIQESNLKVVRCW